MKIIIDIPEETVNEIKDNAMFASSISSDIRWDITSAIANGIPLDQLIAEIERLTITEGGEDYTRKMAELYSLKIKVLQIIDKYRGSEG